MQKLQSKLKNSPSDASQVCSFVCNTLIISHGFAPVANVKNGILWAKNKFIPKLSNLKVDRFPVEKLSQAISNFQILNLIFNLNYGRLGLPQMKCEVTLSKFL